MKLTSKLIGGILLTASCALFAQDATVEGKFELESMIVKDKKTVKAEDEAQKDNQVESLNSESYIDQKELTKKKSQHVTEILGDQPGVEATGSHNPLFKKIQIRGLDDSRVTQKVDGVRRIDNLDSRISMDSSVDTASLRSVSVTNGADSAKHGDGTLGGAVNYKTLSAKDFLSKKKSLGGEVKGTYDSATQMRSFVYTAAGKFTKQSDLLLQYNTASSEKFDSGIEDGERYNEEMKARKEAGMVKYDYKFSPREKLSFKFQHKLGKTLESAYNGRFNDDSTDYTSRANDYLLTYEKDNFSSPLLSIKTRAFSNNVYAEKHVKEAFRGLEWTKTKTVEDLSASGVQFENTSVVERKNYQVISKQEVEYTKNRMKEDDGTGNEYFGTSTGEDIALALDNEVLLLNDSVSVTMSGRQHSYTRKSDELAADVKDSEGTNHSYTLGVKLKSKTGLAVFSKLGKSNRAPSVRELYQGGGAAFRCHRPDKVCKNMPNSELDSEHAFTREVGVSYLKSNLAYADKVRVKVSYFNEAITDFIDTTPFMYKLEADGSKTQAGPNDATHREYNARNQSLVIRQGIEAQASYDFKGFDAKIAYSAINMDCRDCVDFFTATNINEEFFAAPADKISFALGYEFKSAPVYLSLDGKIVDTQERLSERYLRAGYRTPAYQVYGMGVDYAPTFKSIGAVSMGVRVNNLLDKQYKVHNSGSGKPELGRNIKFSLAKRF